MALSLRLGLPTLAMILAGPPAVAEAADMTSSDSISGVVTVGPVFGAGESSWLDRGLGKLQSGDDQASIIGGAIVAWTPMLFDRLGAVVTAEAQSQAEPVAGLSEAYLKLRPLPGDAWRLSARVGLFFPPVSLEHDGPEWSLSRTLTPSAINSWVAEEVETTGLEATLRGSVARQNMALTVAAFSGNETSGALLAFRGWALDDLRARPGETFVLPALPARFIGKQAPDTQPVDEVDGRWGEYSKLEWFAAEDLTVSIFGYDNNGDQVSVVAGQYAWRTKFFQTALRWTPDEKTEVLGQFMTGETQMGRPVDGQSPVNVGFVGAYAMISRTIAGGTASARLDYFGVDDRTFRELYDLAEHGFAATADWSWPLSTRIDLITECLAADSDRPDRVRFGLNRSQLDVQARAAVRAAF